MDSIKIEILGAGCKKCQQPEANAKEALANLNLTAEVLHITDPLEIDKRGVMSTPAITINGVYSNFSRASRTSTKWLLNTSKAASRILKIAGSRME